MSITKLPHVAYELIECRTKAKLGSGEVEVLRISCPCFYMKITILTLRTLGTDFSVAISCKCKGAFAIVTLANCTKAYRHVFTSPSSIEKETKATYSDNACLHGMMSIMPTSIVYIATQV